MSAPNNVSTAFDSLFIEVEAAINAINRRGSDAFQHGRHADARALLELIESNRALCAKIVALRREWETLNPQVALPTPEPDPVEPPPKASRSPRASAKKSPAFSAVSRPALPELEIDRPAFLVAARPVLRVRGLKGRQMQITFNAGTVSFDFGNSAIQAPAKGHWSGTAIASARLFCDWARDPEPLGGFRMAVRDGFLELNRRRIPAKWLPDATVQNWDSTASTEPVAKVTPAVHGKAKDAAAGSITIGGFGSSVYDKA